VSDFEKLMI